jgi:hypothetical protein
MLIRVGEPLLSEVTFDLSATSAATGSQYARSYPMCDLLRVGARQEERAAEHVIAHVDAATQTAAGPCVQIWPASKTSRLHAQFLCVRKSDN